MSSIYSAPYILQAKAGKIVICPDSAMYIKQIQIAYRDFEKRI